MMNNNIFFARTLLCLIFLRAYPAVPLFLRTYPAVPLFFFSHLPCCDLNFLRTYPAVPLISAHFPCYAFIFLRTYPAVPLFFCDEPGRQRGATFSGSAPRTQPANVSEGTAIINRTF